MRFAALAETIRKNLVHHTTLEEFRCIVQIRICSQLEQLTVIDISKMSVSFLDIETLTPYGIDKVVIVHTGISWHEPCAPDCTVLLIPFKMKIDETLPEARTEKYKTGRIIKLLFLRQTYCDLTAPKGVL
jgi:hypothetical protein